MANVRPPLMSCFIFCLVGATLWLYFRIVMILSGSLVKQLSGFQLFIKCLWKSGFWCFKPFWPNKQPSDPQNMPQNGLFGCFPKSRITVDSQMWTNINVSDSFCCFCHFDPINSPSDPGILAKTALLGHIPCFFALSKIVILPLYCYVKENQPNIVQVIRDERPDWHEGQK